MLRVIRWGFLLTVVLGMAALLTTIERISAILVHEDDAMLFLYKTWNLEELDVMHREHREDFSLRDIG
jgi:hypothetical protein